MKARATGDAPATVVRRQARMAPYLAYLASFRHAPDLPSPVTDQERAALQRRRDAAMARIRRG